MFKFYINSKDDNTLIDLGQKVYNILMFEYDFLIYYFSYFIPTNTVLSLYVIRSQSFVKYFYCCISNHLKT